MQPTPTQKNRYNPTSKRKPRLLRGIPILQGLCALLVVLMMLIFYAIFVSSHGLAGFRLHRSQVAQLEAKIRGAQDENQRLFGKIQSFKTDPVAQEKAVRQQLGWVRDNELVIDFLPADNRAP